MRKTQRFSTPSQLRLKSPSQLRLNSVSTPAQLELTWGVNFLCLVSQFGYRCVSQPTWFGVGCRMTPVRHSRAPTLNFRSTGSSPVERVCGCTCRDSTVPIENHITPLGQPTLHRAHAGRNRGPRALVTLWLVVTCFGAFAQHFPIAAASSSESSFARE